MEENTQAPPPTLAEVQALCVELFKQKAVCDTVNERLKEEKKKQEAIEAKIMAAFESSDCEKQAVKGVGTVYLKDYTSYKTPKTMEEKAALKEYMGEEKWEAMVSINSRTLNSWASEEFNKAIEEGNHQFKIPGLEDPTMTRKIMTRKG